MMAFGSNVFISLATRRVIAYHTANDNLMVFVASTLILALVELTSRVGVFSCRMCSLVECVLL